MRRAGLGTATMVDIRTRPGRPGRAVATTLMGAQDMTTFTVWKFDDPEGAERAVRLLRDAQSDGLVKIDDHAIVSWPAGANQPSTRHGHEENWHGAAWGS